MTYGIALKNESNENLVDYTTSLTYYKGVSGTCTLLSTAPRSTNSQALFGFLPTTSTWSGLNGPIPNDGPYADYYVDYYYRLNTHLACNGLDYITTKNTDNNTTWDKYYPRPVSFNKDDLIFFEVPAVGTIGIYQIWWPFTGADHNGKTVENGLTGLMIPSPSFSGSALKYQTITTDLPASTSDYGVVVYDEDGSTIMFDTTREIAAFVDHIFLSSADAQDIINNNTSRVFNLRSSISSLWLCSDGAGATCYKISYSTSGIDMFTLLIRQTGPAQVTISRNYIDTPDFGWGALGPFENYEDGLFIVADFG